MLQGTARLAQHRQRVAQPENQGHRHFDAYLAQFEPTSSAALEWFSQHLLPVGAAV